MIKKILIFLSFLCVLVPTHASSPGDMLFGKWKVVAMLDPLPILGSDENGEKHAIGKYLIINQNEVHFQKKIGLLPIFTESRYDTLDYFYNGKGFRNMDPTNLHLPEMVTEIDIEYKNAMGVHSVYIQSKNSIVFLWRGFFYKAIRAK
ncbi:hypothetical protein [Paraherbaspirillum soli]|uniref:DUF2147 domain-containing protein n=1 Tax=Paraherbaspirillum soli TaxID=631222 RepID=A0ABW0MAE7_9BURK